MQLFSQILIHWKVVYLVDSALSGVCVLVGEGFQRFNTWGQMM